MNELENKKLKNIIRQQFIPPKSKSKRKHKFTLPTLPFIQMSTVFNLIDTNNDGLISQDDFLNHFLSVYGKFYGLTNCITLRGIKVTYNDIAIITADQAFENIPSGELMNEEQFKSWYSKSIERAKSERDAERSRFAIASTPIA